MGKRLCALFLSLTMLLSVANPIFAAKPDTTGEQVGIGQTLCVEQQGQLKVPLTVKQAATPPLTMKTLSAAPKRAPAFGETKISVEIQKIGLNGKEFPFDAIFGTNETKVILENFDDGTTQEAIFTKDDASITFENPVFMQDIAEGKYGILFEGKNIAGKIVDLEQSAEHATMPSTTFVLELYQVRNTDVIVKTVDENGDLVVNPTTAATNGKIKLEKPETVIDLPGDASPVEMINPREHNMNDINQGLSFELTGVENGVLVDKAANKVYEPTLQVDQDGLQPTEITLTEKPLVTTDDKSGDMNYVKVDFMAGDHGTLDTDRVYYVYKSVTLEKTLDVPKVMPSTDWTFSNWDPELSMKYDTDTTHTATYAYDGNDVVPQAGEDKPSVPDHFVKVEFKPGDHGTLTGTTIYWVNPEKEVTLTAPTVNASDGYQFKAWDKPLTGTFKVSTDIMATYDGISNQSVIPYEPADPTKPTDPNDANIPTKDGDGNIIEKDQYVRVAFKVDPNKSGLLTLGSVQDRTVISALIKKDTAWNDVALPTTTGQGDYVFWHWTKAESENVAANQVRTAKFIEDGSNVTHDKTQLPDGYHRVSIMRGEGIALPNILYFRDYAVKDGSTLTQAKFPTLRPSKGYKNPKWNVEEPWNQRITEDTVFTASAVSATFDKQTITEIEIVQDPEKMEYIEGDTPIHDGIQVKLTDQNDNTVTIGKDQLTEYGVSVNPAEDTELTVDDDNGEHFSATVLGKDQDGKPATLTAEGPGTITVNPEKVPEAPTIKDLYVGDKTMKVKPAVGVDVVVVTLPNGTTLNATLHGPKWVDDKGVPYPVDGDGYIEFTVPNGIDLKLNDVVKAVNAESNVSSPEATATVKEKPPVQKPSSPVVDPVTEGDSVIRVMPPSDGDQITITLPDGSNVVVKKDDDGNWKAGDGTAVSTEDGKLQIPVDGDKVVPGGKGVDVTVTDTKTNETSDPTHRDVEAKSEDKTSVHYPNTDIGRGETKVINPTMTDKNGDPVKPDAAPTITDAPGHGIVVTPNPDGSLRVQVPEGYEGPSRVTIGLEVTVGGKTLQTKVVIAIKDEDQPIAPPVDHGGNWITLTPIDKDDQSKLEKGEDIAYIYGYPDKTVRPEGMITRAEAAAMISRLADLDRSDTSKPIYVDTPSGWYNRDINAMVKKNLMFGEDGKFRPNEPITRGEFARALYYIDHKSDKVAPFGDVKGHRYEKAINQAYGNGRISGYPDGTFRPDAPIQRAEAARLLNRFAGRSVSERGLVDVQNDIVRFADLSKEHWAYYEIVEASNSHRYVRMNKDNIEEKWTAIINLVQH